MAAAITYAAPRAVAYRRTHIVPRTPPSGSPLSPPEPVNVSVRYCLAPSPTPARYFCFVFV